MFKKYLLYFLVIAVSFIPIADLFKPGLPLTHDGQDHIARIANFYQNLTEGNIIPRWAGNLNWGYGHPILEFLYPLPSYISSLFHFLGFSLIDSVKIVFGTSMIFSGIFMYLWLSSFLGKYAALVGGILYVFAPYRFINLYVRGDIGEHLAFVFIPLVFYFILKLSVKVKLRYIFGGAVSLAFLILSHNAVSLMLVPAILGYGLYISWLKKFNKDLFIAISGCIVLGFGLSAFFWIPGLLEGKYTLRNIVTTGSFIDRFVKPETLFYGPWSYGGTGEFTVQLGILQWVFLIFSPLTFFVKKRKKDKESLLVLGAIVYTLIAIFLMVSISNFIWERIILLQNFQFPWRFLSITVFTCAILGGFFVSIISSRLKIVAIALFIILVLLFNKNYWHAQEYFHKPESFFTGIYNGTTDTGESAPIWSVRFMEKRPKAKAEVISGQAEIKEVKRTTTTRRYKISSFEKSRILENTLYFPGWTVLVDGKIVDIQFQDPTNRGLITFNVGRGDHVVDIIYRESKIRQYSDIVSLFSLIVIGWLVIFQLKREKQYNKY